MRLTEFVILGAIVTSTSALARDRERAYWQFDAGSAYFEDRAFDNEEVSFDKGWSVSHRIGASSEWLSGELEVGLHKGDGTLGNREFDPLILALTLGLARKLLKTDWVDWYVGGGLGLAGSISGDGGKGSPYFNTAHVETGLIVKPTARVHFVPHARLTGVQHVADDEQVIHSIRLGVRFNSR